MKSGFFLWFGSLSEIILMILCNGCNSLQNKGINKDIEAQKEARSTIKTSKEVLSPVYGPLAEEIVRDFDLAEKEGIGIDLGSGPGDLIIELCKRTRLHWINADINPHFFPHFTKLARNHGFGPRVSAIYADAQDLPFKDNYAEIIVSRASFQYWQDKVRAFREIYRVLKPGGTAFIGRGFSENLPLETAKKVAKKLPDAEYDLKDTASQLRDIMNELQIQDYRLHILGPQSPEKINYGLWIEFHKPMQ